MQPNLTNAGLLIQGFRGILRVLTVRQIADNQQVIPIGEIAWLSVNKNNVAKSRL